MEKIIVLEEILKNEIESTKIQNLPGGYDNISGDFKKKIVLNAMREAIRQALELASENVEEYYSTSDEKLDESLKESILQTIKQIK